MSNGIASGSNIRKAATLTAALVVSVLQASAVTYRDIDTFVTGGQGQLISGSTSASGTFSILNPSEGQTVTIGSGYGTESGKTYSDIAGFMPGYDLAYNASAYFYVRDDGDTTAKEVVSIKLEGLQFDTQYSYSATTIADGDSWLVNAALLVLLNIDGTLQYSINALDGSDFFLEYARLDVDAINIFPKPSPSTGGTSVPDGGATAILLGAGLLGMVVVRRKK